MTVSNRAAATDSRITAVLGPTNTGKTHFALEQMGSFKSGIIGFPLRLLARENYERLVAAKGIANVALVTGEEKIVPAGARYFACTVESMPLDRDFEFVGVDEIHLCADPDRGHVFTDRLLRARGTHVTMFMGAETIRPLLAALIPRIEFIARPRLSALSYTGFKKMTRLPKRSAVVAFSVDDVYAIAEMIRRQRGGTAVVLGALSPRTRNKQVEMYQSGEVDFLVATDAIGMGLNMDIHHIALAATRKFDGHQLRELERAEIAQIAGRAGRYLRNGTFGVTGRVHDLDDETVQAVEHHEFDSLRALCWRNADLDFSSPASLRQSLDKGSGNPLLIRGRAADDDEALTALMGRDEVMARASGQMAVTLLWEVCQIPDFRKTLSETHQELLAGIYVMLMDEGVLAPALVAKQIDALDRIDGEVDTLMARIAHIRTWTYITHKSDWLNDAGAWAERARAVEDRLSDALHEALMKRFVDRRAAVLIRAMDKGGELLAGVRADGEVVVEGQVVGMLDGFRYSHIEDATDDSNRKAVMAAARRALRPEIGKRLGKMLNAVPKQFKIDEQGQILFQSDPTNPLPGQPVAKLRRGSAVMQPEIEVLDTPLLEGQDKAAIEEKLREWLKTHIATVLEALVPLTDEAGLEGTARGIAFQLHEAMGIVPRADLEELIAGLDEAGRASLRQRKVRLGPVLVFIPALNKPASVRLRALLWSLWNNAELPAKLPHDGATSVTLAEPEAANHSYYRAIGYPVYGPRAIRVDMLDRLISAIYDGAKDGKFQAQSKMAEWLGCSLPVLYEVLAAMGHRQVAAPAPEAVSAEISEPAPQSVIPSEAEGSPSAAPEEDPSASLGMTSGDAADNTELEVVGEPVVAIATEEPPKPAPAPRPELAWFILRRGKAYGGARPDRPPRRERPAPVEGAEADETKPRGRRRPARAKGGEPRPPPPFEKLIPKPPPPFEKLEGPPRADKRKDRERSDERGGRDRRPTGGDRHRGDRDQGERIFTAKPPPAAVPEASPFGALAGFKIKSGDGK